MHFALQLCVSSLTHMTIRRTTSDLTLSTVCASTGWESDEVRERRAWNRAWPWLMAARDLGFRTNGALLPNQNQRRGSQMTWIFHTDQLKGEPSAGVQISDSSLSLIKATMSNEKATTVESNYKSSEWAPEASCVSIDNVFLMWF